MTIKVYGLTGGIGSGKSTVARLLAEAGFAIFDADDAARSARVPATESGQRILSAFGTLDPRELSRLCFIEKDAAKNRALLESILLPEIHRLFELWKKSLTGPVGIYEASLLVESGRYKDLDGLIVIRAPELARLTRLRQRGLSDTEIRARLAAQTSDHERQKIADFIIDNNESLADLTAKVSSLAARLRAP